MAQTTTMAHAMRQRSPAPRPRALQAPDEQDEKHGASSSPTRKEKPQEGQDQRRGPAGSPTTQDAPLAVKQGDRSLRQVFRQRGQAGRPGYLIMKEDDVLGILARETSGSALSTIRAHSGGRSPCLSSSCSTRKPARRSARVNSCARRQGTLDQRADVVIAKSSAAPPSPKDGVTVAKESR